MRLLATFDQHRPLAVALVSPHRLARAQRRSTAQPREIGDGRIDCTRHSLD